MWRVAPAGLALQQHEIHVWRVRLDAEGSDVRALYGLLTADERRRAARLVFDEDRDHFVVARGMLRLILGHYLSREPEHLRFCYNTYGKPALADNEAQWRFNVSHSHGLALYAITRGREVGVDIEYMRPQVAAGHVAERFFSPQEVRTLRSLPREQQVQAFFDCWTRKEAFIKAVGEGLTLPLDQFDVSLTPGKPAALLRTRWNPAEATRWLLQALEPGPGYAAALAGEGHDWSAVCWQWSKA